MQGKITVKELHGQAQALGACSLFTGGETQDQLMELFLSPQGMEFCTENNFPSLDQIRDFKGEMAETYGVFIDSRDIRLANRSMVVLIGDTTAELVYDDPKKGHNVVLLHGAKANITADNYAVVFVQNVGGQLKTRAKNGAKIL